MSQFSPAYPTAGPSSVLAHQHDVEEPKKKPRRRLTPAGMELLQAQAKKWEAAGREPDLAARRLLLAKLQAIPGCEHYTLPAMTTYIKAHISTSTTPQTPRIVGTHFTTLTQPVRSQLAALLAMEEGLSPTPEKVRLWARMVEPTGAMYTDVADWVMHLQIEMKKQLEKQATTRLPTPATTVSPEPPSPVLNTPPKVFTPPIVAYDGEHSYYKPRSAQSSPQAPPKEKVIYPLAFPRRLVAPPGAIPQAHAYRGSPPPFSPASPNIPPATPVHAASPPLKRSSPAMMTPPLSTPTRNVPQRTPTLRDIIAQGVADAETSPTTPKGALPTSAEEFSALFEPYEAKIAILLKTLQS